MYQSNRIVPKSLRDDWNASQTLPPALRRRKDAIAKAPTAGFHDVRTIASNNEEDCWIGLEISSAKLYQLLVRGVVSLTDFRCLDHASKCRVRTLCLHACAHCLNDCVSTVGKRPCRCTNRPSESTDLRALVRSIQPARRSAPETAGQRRSVRRYPGSSN